MKANQLTNRNTKLKLSVSNSKRLNIQLIITQYKLKRKRSPLKTARLAKR